MKLLIGARGVTSLSRIERAKGAQPTLELGGKSTFDF